MTRIGVFGGQFDPPHNGHLAVVRAATKQLGLDRVLVVPSARPPHRPAPATPAETRYRLAQAAFAGEPGVEVSRIEIDRDGPGYTAKTLEALSGPDRELYLILGADQLAALESWNRPSGYGAGPAAVAARPGAPPADAAARLVMEPVDVSSSALRRLIGEGADVSTMVPAAVADAIARQGLYGQGASRLIASIWGSTPDRHHPARASHRVPGSREARHRHRDPGHARRGQLHRPFRDLLRAESPAGAGDRRPDRGGAEARPADAPAGGGASPGRLDLLDYLDVVVHVFTPEARSFYRLEALWGQVPSETYAAG